MFVRRPSKLVNGDNDNDDDDDDDDDDGQQTTGARLATNDEVSK